MLIALNRSGAPGPVLVHRHYLLDVANVHRSLFCKELLDILEQMHSFYLPINLMDCFDMHQLVDEPTHLNNEGKPTSPLDLAFTNVPHLLEAPAEVMPPLSPSDHLSVTSSSNAQLPLNLIPLL